MKETNSQDAKRPIQKGTRSFLCNECNHQWVEATRDYLSPSGENCPLCGEWEFPYRGEPDGGTTDK